MRLAKKLLFGVAFVMPPLATFVASEQAGDREVFAPTSRQVIEVAIARGVPIFNSGQTAACAAIYEVAALSLLSGSEPALPERVRRVLHDAALPGDPDPGARAWQLRHALDLAHAALGAEEQGGSMSSESMIVVDEFDAASVGVWQVVNDTVMGGRSRSAILLEGGTGVFAGDVSFENNGGFASVRRAVPPGSFAGFDGLSLRVRGDGKTYAVNVSEQSRITPDVYRAKFETQAGEWIEIRLQFAEMQRSVMGYRPPNSPPIDPASVRSLGLIIGDKQEGPFRLEIDSIRLYHGAERSRVDHL